jgi:hypothetical protein
VSRAYKNVWHRPVEGLAPGESGDLELSAEDEAQYLGWGRLEIVPVEYEVTGPRRVSGCEPGEKFSAAFPQHTEAMLIAAGHIEPAKAAKPKAAKSKPADKGA